MDDHEPNKLPLPPDHVDWDYQLSVPTNWRIRGKNPTMHLLTDEQMEALASTGNPWPQNFFFLGAGIAAALLIQLKSGTVDEASKGILWLAFYLTLLLTAFFASLAVREYFKVKKAKREIKKQSPTAAAEAPTLRARSAR